MNSQELLQKQVPVEVTGSVIDEKCLAVLEVKIEEFRKQLKRCLCGDKQSCKAIDSYLGVIEDRKYP